MKKAIIYILIFLPLYSYNQIYLRTGKSVGVQVQTSPFSSVQNNRAESTFNNHEIGFSLLRMYKPGLYYKAGYSRLVSRHYTIEYLNGSFFNAGIGFDKFLKNIMTKKVRSHCIYHNLGLVGELNYSRYYNRFVQNSSHGEISFKIGLSFFTHFQNMSKKSKGQTVHLEVFYFNGLTPFLSLKQHDFRRQGLGVHIRFMKHKVYNFLI